MIPGPKYIYKCPNCGNLLSKESLNSGNTFGAEQFSDGKRIAPMLPEFPNLTKCEKCNNFLWLDKLKEIGTYGWKDNQNSNWQNADEAKFLEIDDYFDALKSEIVENKIDEGFIRKHIWWAYNDRRRDGLEIFIDENDELRWKENCIELLNLLDFSDINQRIMTAEINRNLGNFEKCISIINTIDNNDMEWLQEKFITECNKNNKWVIKLD